MSQSEQQEKLELDEEQLMQCLAPQPQQKILNKSKIKSWVAYCKLRGKKSSNQGYSQQMQQIGSFDSIPGFLKLHTAIKDASDLERDIKLMYFLKGCEPLWEKWLNSGCLLFQIKFRDWQKDDFEIKVLNKTWQFLLLSLIGNSLPSIVLTDKRYLKKGEQSIIGIVLSRRDKIYLIEIWFRSTKHYRILGSSIEKDLKNELRHIADYQKNLKISFKLHKDSYQTNSTIKGSHTLKGLNSSF